MTVSAEMSEAEPYPFGPAEELRLHPRYAEAREQLGLACIRMPFGTRDAWLAVRYADVKFVLSDRRFSRAQAAGRDDVPRARPTPDPPTQLLSMDPPDHTRVRRLVTKAFTTGRVEQMRPGIQEVVATLLDDMVAQGQPADLAESLSWPLPVKVICDLLGVPETDQDRFRTLTDKTLQLGAESSREEMAAARVHLNDYLAELIDRRRQQPTDDLLSALVNARDGGDRLGEEELVRLAVTLLISGYETTANQIGNAVYVLLSEGRWEEMVCGGPDLVPSAVEELLRYITLGASVDFARIATEDVMVGDQPVRAGEVVFVNFYAANHDPRAFTDPEWLDLTRKSTTPHMTFGHGVHRCLGAPLARLELQVVLTALITRFPTLRLAVAPEEVQWQPDRLVRGVQSLPVAW